MMLDIYLLFQRLRGDRKVDDASQTRCLLKCDAAAVAAVVIQVCQCERAGACFMAPRTDFYWHLAWTMWPGRHSVRAEKNFSALGTDIMSALAFRFSSQSNFTPDRHEYQPSPFPSECVFQLRHLQ